MPAAHYQTWLALSLRDGDYATLHAGTHAYLLRASLSRLAPQLDPAHFVRVQRSTIVRIAQISALQALANRDALLRLRDGSLLRASRTHIALLLERLRGLGSAVQLLAPPIRRRQSTLRRSLHRLGSWVGYGSAQAVRLRFVDQR